MWFSSPCNPSGSVYSREELTALAKVLENILKSLWLQMKSTSTSTSQELFAASIPGMLEKTVTVNGVAKAFAMTGWRIGYIEVQNSSLKLVLKYKDR
jgi:aspartate aminotransferase